MLLTLTLIFAEAPVQIGTTEGCPRQETKNQEAHKQLRAASPNRSRPNRRRRKLSREQQLIGMHKPGQGPHRIVLAKRRRSPRASGPRQGARPSLRPGV